LRKDPDGVKADIAAKNYTVTDNELAISNVTQRDDEKLETLAAPNSRRHLVPVIGDILRYQGASARHAWCGDTARLDICRSGARFC
jgi:hypothetical protein